MPDQTRDGPVRRVWSDAEVPSRRICAAAPGVLASARENGMWVWGWRTAVLALGSAHCLTVAAALLRPARNRVANALLAVLLIVIVGVLTPFTLGFAGAYDA